MTILAVTLITLILCVSNCGWKMHEYDSEKKNLEFVVEFATMIFLVWLILNVFRVRYEFGMLLGVQP